MQVVVPFCDAFFCKGTMYLFLTSWYEGAANLRGEYFNILPH